MSLVAGHFLLDFYYRLIRNLFFFADYERKEWCGLEWRAIRDLLKKRQAEDIMPMRFDNADIPGLFSIDGYIDLQNYTPEETANFILKRLQGNNNSPK